MGCFFEGKRMRFGKITSEKELENRVEELGFLPFFRNEIEGFSIEEMTPRELWFSDEEGPWEWKGPVIRGTGCAYGKFFKGKAMYVSARFFPDFANYRRDGYDYDARVDEGIARRRDTFLMEELWKTPSLISKELKARVCFTEDRKKGYEGSLTHLQMMCYLNIADFEYAVDRKEKPYGWGLARYTTPEAFFGQAFRDTVYRKQPEASKQALFCYLKGLLPHASDGDILALIG